MLTRQTEIPSAILDIFVETNLFVTLKTTCIMSDKDLQTCEILSENFSNDSTLICLFHPMRSFKKEVTTE